MLRGCGGLSRSCSVMSACCFTAAVTRYWGLAQQPHVLVSSDIRLLHEALGSKSARPRLRSSRQRWREQLRHQGAAKQQLDIAMPFRSARHRLVCSEPIMQCSMREAESPQLCREPTAAALRAGYGDP